jgi:hypothetical protein
MKILVGAQNAPTARREDTTTKHRLLKIEIKWRGWGAIVFYVQRAGTALCPVVLQLAIALFVAMGRTKTKKDKLLAKIVLQAKKVTLLRLAANSALPVNTQVSIATAA